MAAGSLNYPSPHERAGAIGSREIFDARLPAKLPAVFVVGSDDKALSTPVK